MLDPEAEWELEQQLNTEIARLNREIERLKRTEAMYHLFRSVDPDIPRHTLEMLVKSAYELCRISRGRGAEILREPLWTFLERGWYQDLYPERIKRLEQFVAGICACKTPAMAGWSAAAWALLEDLQHLHGADHEHEGEDDVHVAVDGETTETGM